MSEKQAALYINSKGLPVTHGSYSSRQTFKHCPREFQLNRIDGWSDRTKRAATFFGTVLESAVKFYEENGRMPGTASTTFQRLWEEVKSSDDFDKWVYSDSEGDWNTLMQTGKEMCTLYEIRAPFLPISTDPKALWSQSIRKKIFPGTQLDKLENKAVLDILSFPRLNHPMLPAIPAEPVSGCSGDPCICKPGWGHNGHRSLIIDMKTSGADLDTDLVMLDPQLAEYAWQSRIPDVAFLWFVKKSHETRKGNRVTLLADLKDRHAGFELIVLWEDDDVYYLAEYKTLRDYEAVAKNVKGNALKAVKAEFGARVDVYPCQRSAFTKQRLQFAAARFTDQEMDEVGRSVAQTTVEMVRAHNEGFYPQLSGIRFPNQKCNFCSMRYICLNRPEQRDQNLTKRGEEWLDGIADNEDKD